MLQNLANKPSYSKEAYMMSLQPFVDNNKARMNQFLNALCEVPDFYDSLEVSCSGSSRVRRNNRYVLFELTLCAGPLLIPRRTSISPCRRRTFRSRSRSTSCTTRKVCWCSTWISSSVFFLTLDRPTELELTDAFVTNCRLGRTRTTCASCSRNSGRRRVRSPGKRTGRSSCRSFRGGKCRFRT